MSLSWPDPLPSWGPVRLRPFRQDDLALVAELATDPYVPLIGTVPTPFTVEAGLAYLERQHQRLVEGIGYSFAIARAQTDQAVGGVGLWLEHRTEGRASAGYIVAPSCRGAGFGRAALHALTDFAWTRPDLHRVELFIEPWNASSIAVAEAVGYVRERVLPRHIEIGGQRRDVLLYALSRVTPESQTESAD